MTAASEVLSALAQSGLPLEAQAFLAAVSEGEVPTVAGQSAFRILYSGGTPVDPTNANVATVGRWRYWAGDLSAFPAWGGAKLGNGLISTAAGFCQDTHTTFEDSAGFGITAFDPQSQIVFNWKLAQGRFAEHTSRTLRSVLQGSVSDRALIHLYLGLAPNGQPGGTWPGGCDGGFVARYATNLAALQSPPPAPPPPPPPVEATISIPLPSEGTDQAGNKVKLNWAMATALVIGLNWPMAADPPTDMGPEVWRPASPVSAPTCPPGDLRALLVPSPCR